MKRLIGTVSCVLTLAACAPGLQRNVDGESERALATIKQHTERVREPELYVSSTNQVAYDAPEPIAAPSTEPAVLDALFSYSADNSGTLEEAAGYLSKSIHLPIRCTPDAIARAREVHGKSEGEGASAVGQFAFSGRAPVRTLLNQLTVSTGTAWRWTGSEIRIYYLDTKTFEIEAISTTLKGNYTISNASSNSSTGGGSGSGSGSGGASGGSAGGSGGLSNQSQQTTTMDYSFDIFKDVVDALKPMLTPNTGTAAVSPATTSVTIHDTQAVLDTVEAYVHDVNARLRRQVEIEVTLLSVEATDGNTLGIDWQLMRHATDGAYRVDALSTSTAGGDTQALQFSVTDPRSAWNGSKLLISALRQQVHATVERSNVVHAMNNQRVAVQANDKDSFLVASQTILVPNAGQSTNPIFVEQVTGLALSIVPIILDNHEVLLELQGTLSTPRAPKHVTLNSNTFELPRSRDNQIQQRARLSSGSTLMLTGLDFNDTSSDNRGIGSAKFNLLGGGTNTSAARKTLVILITPHVTSG